MALKLYLTSPTETGRIELKGGFVAWRRLGSADLVAILAHFDGLTEEQWRLRFFGVVGRDSLRRRYGAIDYARTELVGAEIAGEIVALLEILPDAHGASMEIALSVRRDLEGAGIGRALLDLAIDHAARSEVDKVELEFLASNGAMRHIAEKLGFVLRRDDDVIFASLTRGTQRLVCAA